MSFYFCDTANMKISPAPIRIPEPLESAQIRMADGAPITLRRHGNPFGARIVISHGNGLAADLYHPFWSLLTDRFDIILYDWRSHGWNPVWNRQNHTFPTMVGDSQRIVRAIDDHFGAKPLIGVFHSSAALVALLHQLENESGFAGLLLFETPVCPPSGAPEDNMEIGFALAERTRQRKVKFETREELNESIKRSSVFKRIHPDVMELFGLTTLRPGEDGGYELCCPADHEAQIYDYYFGWAMQAYEKLEHHGLSCPARAIGSDPTIPYSFLPSVDLSTLVALDYDFVPDTTHFLPLEVPVECASITVAFLEEHGFA